MIKRILLRIRKLLEKRPGVCRWILLAAPLTVYLLPAFQTTIQEDLVILFLFLYLFLRTANEKRLHVSENKQTLFITLLLGSIYVIGWLGLLRGYLDSAGRWLVLYPVPLIVYFFLRMDKPRESSSIHRIFVASIVILSFALFFLSTVFILFVGEDSLFSQSMLNSSRIPYLLVVPTIGWVASIANRTPSLIRGRDHLLFLILMGFVFCCVWGENFNTWRIWYEAGEAERAWTPFKYDAPADIERAERQPYKAADLYNKVRERILMKGDIPRYLNWPFFMQYRMAYQFMRKKEPVRCARMLLPGNVDAPKHIDLMKTLWHMEFVWSMMKKEPDYTDSGRIWVDGELNKDEEFYLLDRWGRVYLLKDGLNWIVWKPAETFNDAVDLEILDGAFIVLRSSGVVHTSKPIELIQENPVFPSPREKNIDLEIFQDRKCAIVVNSLGELFFYGVPPESFPNNNNLKFNTPVIADLELEPFGNGYYLLDIYGAVHVNHSGGTPSIPNASPPVPKSLLPYWTDLNMAVDLELDPKGRGLYVYNRLGEVFTIAVTPYRETYRPPKTYPRRGISLETDSDGNLFALESNGCFVNIP